MQEMVYNAHAIMRDYFTYEDILEMPLGKLFDQLDFFGKKTAEIAKRQADEKLKAELTGRRQQAIKPKTNRRKGL